MSFSIIIPCYQAEKTLGRTLESLIPQKNYLDRIILVDDGSTDNMAEVARHYQSQHPDLIDYYYQHNQGPAVARNKGAEYAQGDYCLFLDADDTLTSEALKTFTTAFETNPGVDILTAGYTAIHGEHRRDRLPTPQPTREKLLNAFWFGKYSLCGGATALRSALLKKYAYPETISHGEDLVFFSHLLANHASLTLPFVALEVYHHPDSLRHASEGVLTEGEAMIPLLFDPRVLPEQFMRYKAKYHADHLVSLARVAVKLKRYKEARADLIKAGQIDMMIVFQWKAWKTFLKTIISV